MVGVSVFSQANDLTTLIPFLTSLAYRFERKFTTIIADAGYESEKNYVYLKENNQVAYIKPVTYEQAKSKKFKSQIGKRENMVYEKNKITIPVQTEKDYDQSKLKIVKQKQVINGK